MRRKALRSKFPLGLLAVAILAQLAAGHGLARAGGVPQSRPSSRPAGEQAGGQAESARSLRRRARDAQAEAARLQAKGEHAAALAKWEQSLRLLRQAHGGDHAEIAEALAQTAVALHGLGRTGEALGRLEAALAMQARLHGGRDHLDVAAGRLRAAEYLRYLGRSAEACKHAAAAAEMCLRLAKAGGGQAPAAAAIRCADLLYALGKAGEAREAYEAAARVYERTAEGKVRPERAHARRGAALCLWSVQGPQAAREALDAAVDLYRKAYRGRDHEERAKCLWYLGRCLLQLGRPAEALKRHEAALAMRRRLAKGEAAAELGSSLAAVAECQIQLRRPQRALATAREALAVEQKLAPDRRTWALASAHTTVGRCLRQMHKTDEALRHFEAALAIYRTLHKGKVSCELISAYSLAAGGLQAVGRPEEALKLYQQALAVSRRLHGRDDHRDTAMCLRSVASCLFTLGRYPQAVGYYEQALAMWRRLHKDRPDNPTVLSGLSALAACLDQAGRSVEALPMHRAAAEMAKRLYGDRDHLSVVWVLHSHGKCLFLLGRPGEALPLYRRALAMHRRLTDGRDTAHVGYMLNDVANCLVSMGRPAEAWCVYQEALGVRKRLYGDRDHADVATNLNDLGGCLFSLGRTDEALRMFRAAVEMQRRICGRRDHPYLSGLITNYATGLDAAGKTKEALALYREALAMNRRLFKGVDHPDVATGTALVARCLGRLGRPAEALELNREALEMRRRIYRGVEHADLARSYGAIAHCLSVLGRPGEALATAKAALAAAERARSPDAYQYAAALGRLYLGSPDQPAEAVKVLEKAVAGIEQARIDVGGSDLDRAAYFAHIRRASGAFEAMIWAQLRLGRADKALEYAERGRALGLRGVLERGRRLRGGDLLGVVEAAAASRGDRRLLDEIAGVRRREHAASAQVATLTAQINLVRARADLSEAQRGRQVEALSRRLDAARDEHLAVRRVIYNLAGRAEAAPALKPLAAGEIQALLRAKQRLVLYAVSDQYATALLVRPPGEAVDAEMLVWPGEAGGRPVREAELADAVRRYVAGMIVEGMRARGLDPSRMSDRRLGARGVSRAAAKHSPSDHAALGHRLFQALVPKRFRAELRSAGLVYVVPDGVLHRLPFETLVTAPAQGKGRAAARAYWLDAWPPLVYGPSGTVLVNRKKARDRQVHRLAAGSRPRREATLLGDPAFAPARAASSQPAAAPPRRGALVTRVTPGSPGSRAGLAAGAVITRYGPHDVAGVDTLDEAFDRLSALLRRRKLKTTPLVRFWARGAWVERPLPAGQADLGVKLVDLTAELRERLAAGQGLDAASRAAAVERSGYLSRYGALVPLPGTRREVLRIYRTLTGSAYRPPAAPTSAPASAPARSDRVTVLLGSQATRPRLYEAAAGSRYLHLATHGLADTSRQAVYSSLALAQPPVATPEDFGFLTLMDLFDNWWGRLGATELVVLSACETQRGRVEAGEGVFALTWGFMYAGAPAVIASLWQVSDETTAEMMGQLYKRLAASGRGGGAGRAAKLEAFTAVRRALRARHAEPYFWAPFVYVGDPR